ncbi:hypothetical protein KC976_04400 [Candidatus Saccharibacteria bacterium]|nr:hypothetical protein [Candidatus Saccharibacteria bacterium]
MATEQPIITKQQALDMYDGNGAKLARALNTTRQCVSAWRDGPIPEWAVLKIRFILKPELFEDSAA